MNYRMAIVGPKDVTSVFRSTGAHVYSAETGADAINIIRDIRKNMQTGDKNVPQYAILMVVEKLMQQISETEYEKVVGGGALPAVIAVPGIEGGSGASLRKLKKLAERAIGSDILK